MKEMGSRLECLINDSPGGETAEKRFLESLGVTRRTLRSWYKGEHAPDPYQLQTIIDAVNSEAGRTLSDSESTLYDANYVLMGETSSEKRSVQSSLKEIKAEIAYLRHLVEDGTLGLDGVISRLSIRLLDDLRRRPKDQPPEPLVSGVIMDREIELIEPYSIETRLATVRLDYGAKVQVRDGANVEARDGDVAPRLPRRPGRFLTMIANNIMRNQKYTYIMPGPKTKWIEPVRAFKEKLVETGVPGPKISTNVKFWTTKHPIGAGFVIMKLDLAEFRKEHEALLKELVDHYLDPDEGLLGQVMPGSSRMHGGSLMDRERLKLALEAWEQLESAATSVSRT